MKDFGKLNFSVSFQPTSAFPLDGRTVFSSYASALAAAKTAEEIGSTNTKYHIGMKLLVVENDVPTWYTITKDKTLAAESADAVSAITEHNASSEAHTDIRTLLSELAKRMNALADSDDTTLDQLSELVAYIKNNRSLIEQVTTGKISVDAIVNDLTTNNSKKVLSAAQGVAIKALIDALDKKITDSGADIPEKLPNPNAITFTGAVTGTYDGSAPLTVNIPEGGGESNLLVVTITSENGEYVSSHTYQEIKAFVENGGDVALCVEGTITSIFSLATISDTHAFFGKQVFSGQIFISQGYYIKADGSVTFDQQMIEIPEGGSSITVDDALNPNSTNPVQNKVICDVVLQVNETLAQMQGSIPTDDHINELINTALGVIENGTY